MIAPLLYPLIGIGLLSCGLVILAAMSFVNAVDPDESPDSPEPYQGVVMTAELIVPRAASHDSPEMLWPASPDLFTDGAGI